MKIGLIIVCLSFSLLSLAKSNPLDGFSRALSENIETVIENNPEKYESEVIKKSLGKRRSRGPASVQIDSNDKTDNINTFDKLEHGFSKF